MHSADFFIEKKNTKKYTLNKIEFLVSNAMLGRGKVAHYFFTGLFQLFIFLSSLSSSSIVDSELFFPDTLADFCVETSQLSG